MIRYSTGNNQFVEFSQSTIDHLSANRQLQPSDREAGGQLFAKFHKATIHVCVATGPHEDARRSRTSYSPNRNTERLEIENLFKQNLHFVGDWHTHPEEVASPSSVDISSATDMFAKSHHNLAGFLMVIVGQLPAPVGLSIGICNEKGWHQLNEANRLPSDSLSKNAKLVQ